MEREVGDNHTSPTESGKRAMKMMKWNWQVDEEVLIDDRVERMKKKWMGRRSGAVAWQPGNHQDDSRLRTGSIAPMAVNNAMKRDADTENDDGGEVGVHERKKKE